MNFSERRKRRSYNIEDILGIKDVPMKSDGEEEDDSLELSPTTSTPSLLESSISEGTMLFHIHNAFKMSDVCTLILTIKLLEVIFHVD